MYIFPFIVVHKPAFWIFYYYVIVFTISTLFDFVINVLIVSVGDKISGYSLLKPFLSKQGRQAVQVQSDGSCLFCAISVALTGNQAYHLQL